MASRYEDQHKRSRAPFERWVRSATWESDLGAVLIAFGSFATVVCGMLLLAP